MDHCPKGRDPPYWRVSIVSPHRRWISGWNRNLLLTWHRLTALEAIARLPPAGAPIIRSWSAADTALCISTIVGYVVTLTLAFLLHKRVNVVQESLIGLGDMAQKIITIIIFISVDIDNYHDKCQIFISFKFKARFLLQSESFRNQTINLP